MKYISEEKERLYKTIQEEIATTNSSIRRVCMLHGMNDSKAYRRWLSKQKETEDAKVITLKPKNEVYEKRIFIQNLEKFHLILNILIKMN